MKDVFLGGLEWYESVLELNGRVRGEASEAERRYL